MTTQIENPLVEELNIVQKYYATNGDELLITFKEFIKVREDITDANFGDLVGHIELLYPIAGLQISQTLEVLYEYVEDFETNSGVFKLPFVEEKESITLLEYNLWVMGDSIYEEDIIQGEVSKCVCGGYLVPHYEEYPNDVYCSNRCN